MTLDEALTIVDDTGSNQWASPVAQAAKVVADAYRRLQSPRSGVCQIGPPKQIAPTVFATWGIVETDEDFAERAGRKVTEAQA